MKALIKWTLWQKRWSILWWSIGTFALIFINLIFYPTFKDQAAELQKSFDKLPEAAVQLMGGSTDFYSPVGFLNSQIYFMLLPLLLGILAINLGKGLIGKEEQDKTIENLLSRPVSRSRLLSSKAISGLIILIAVGLVSALTTVLTAMIVNLDLSVTRMLLVTAVCLLLVLSFGAVAFAITATGKARLASVGTATAIAMGGYLLSSLSGTVTWLKVPSKFLPFDYYQSEAILRGSYNWWNITFFVGLTVACWIIAWISFRKRDLT